MNQIGAGRCSTRSDELLDSRSSEESMFEEGIVRREGIKVLCIPKGNQANVFTSLMKTSSA